MTHSTHKSPAEILMYGHHRASGGSMSANEPQYKRGGRPKSYMRNGRSCHAEGDTVGVNPVNGYEYPESPENKRRGGRACHAEGDTVEPVPYKRGGRSHRRRHHDDGGQAYDTGGEAYQEGGDVYQEGGDVAQKRRGGMMRRRHHEDGGEAYQEGGDIAEKRRGGAMRRRHHAEGDMENREHHNFGDVIKGVGRAGLSMAPFPLNLLGHILKKGGSAHNRRRHHSEGEEVPLKRAMGGAGKVRKGMMMGNGSLG